MASEGTQFANVLERIARDVIKQLDGLPDTLLNQPVPLPDANTLYAIATHLAGATEFWAVQTASGRDAGRNRLAEFRATGGGAALINRYERLIAAVHDALDNLPDAAMNGIPPQPPAEYRSTGGLGDVLTLRNCLLHAIEHGALHQGHIQITRQLMVDGDGRQSAEQ
ncbi:MAG: DinB family protein [Thermomicrobia bacterium]|nr:DinB family protein [Thermomicrobia bacterium]